MAAINPLDPSPLQTAYTATGTKRTQISPEVVYDDSDLVTISSEAQEKFKAEMANSAMVNESWDNKAGEQAEAGRPSWMLGSSNLKSGEYTLKNGNVQKIEIDGDTLTIEEFSKGKLVKSVNGTITENGAVLDTEYYDSSGKVSQSIHTEMMTSDAAQGWTGAFMTRDVTWYEDGKRRGEMHDQMQLQSWNSASSDVDEETAAAIDYVINNGTKAVDTDVDALLEKTTVERHALDYFTQIKEYGPDGNRLVRDILLEQSGRYEQLSNRNEERVGNVEARTSVEMERKTGLRLEIREYDKDGDLVKESRFSDEQKKNADGVDGTQEQNLSVSWYNDGELVKRSHGNMIIEETATMGLPDRPGFLEVFGMNQDEYLGEGPKSAIGYMSTKLLTSSGEADFYVEGVSRHVNDRDYNVAEGVAEYGDYNRPYSISWTDELYKDGELVMRQKDTEGARETSFWQQQRGMLFRKAGALTENADPNVLHESSHEQEIFENGKTTSRQSMEAREWVDVNMDGPDELRTTSRYEQESGEVGGHEVATVIQASGGVDGADPDSNAAARGFSGEAKQTLETLQDVVNSLNKGETDKYIDQKVRFDFEENYTDPSIGGSDF